MQALGISFLLTTVNLLVGFLAPGLLLDIVLTKRWRFPSDSMSVVLRVICLGSLYATAQFFLVYLAIAFLGMHPYFGLIFKYAVDVLLLMCLLGIGRSELESLSRQICADLRTPVNLILLGLAVAAGLAAMFRCPYALDNAATGWTAYFIDGARSSFAHSQGSPAYISIVYFAGLLLHGVVPLPTIGAALKLPLALLLAFTARRLTARLPFSYPGLSAIAYFLILLGSFVGVYGLFETGKETVFGVSLLYLFIGELFTSRYDAPWRIQTGLVLAAAIAFGAVTVPYALVIVVAFLIFSLGRVRPFEFAFTLLGLSALPLIPTVWAMTHVPFWLAAAAVFLPVVFCYIFRQFTPSIQWMSPLPAAGVLLVSTIAVILCLPVRCEPFYPPFDGTTTFTAMIHSHGFYQSNVILLAAIGLGLSFVLPGFSRNPGLQALAVFPTTALVPIFFVAIFGIKPPFHMQHLWDLAKDIPNWCLPFFFGLFALIALETIVRLVEQLPCRNWRLQTMAGPAIVLCCIAVLAGHLATRKMRWATHWNRPAHYTRIGGHSDPLFAELVERFTRPEYLAPVSRVNINQSHALFLTKNFDKLSTHGAHSLRMYGIGAEHAPLDLSQPNGLETLTSKPAARVVGSRQELNQIDFAKLGLLMEEVERFSDEVAVFCIRRIDGP